MPSGLAMPPWPDVAFGFYYALRLLPPSYRTPEHEAQYFQHMVAHGCNTTTLYGEQAAPLRADGAADLEAWDVARRADAMRRAGLLRPDIPAMLLSSGPAGTETSSAWAARIGDMARDRGWPELLMYSADEPSPAAAAALATQMAQLRRGVHPHLRVATAIAADALDTWAYTHFGDYTWEGERCISHGYAIPSQSGPVGTVGLEGRREGIHDYACLSALESAVAQRPDAPSSVEAAAWMRELRDRIDWPYNRPEDRTEYFWDLSDLERPAPHIAPEEYAAIRARCIELLMAVR